MGMERDSLPDLPQCFQLLPVQWHLPNFPPKLYLEALSQTTRYTSAVGPLPLGVPQVLEIYYLSSPPKLFIIYHD